MQSTSVVPVVAELPAHISETDKVLGHGGYSTVFLGYDCQVGRPVALKFLLPELVGDDEHSLRFRQEATWMCRVRGKRVPEVYAFVASRTRPCIIMEYLPGETLARRTQFSDRLAPDECQHIGAELAEAVAEAHAAGVIHRDIKPDNVMVDPGSDGGEIHVLDWGIATDRLMDEPVGVTSSQPVSQALTTTDKVFGTAPYMAPERWLQGRSGPEVDVYGVGATLYHVAAGRPPLQADTATELQRKQETERPPLLVELRPDLPDQLSKVINDTLAFNPNDRPEPLELGEALLAA